MVQKMTQIVLFVTLLVSFVFTQNIIKVEHPDKKEPIGISGTPLLNTKETLSELAKIGKQSFRAKRTQVVTDTLGTIREFFVSNLETDVFDRVEFKLVAKGVYSQVWFATGEIENNHLDQDIADTLLTYLDIKSGANSVDPTRGVVPIDREYFGSPPDKDGDNLLDVLVSDIKDGYDPDSSTSYIAGFFYSVDQYNDADISPTYRSNERDIIYIDSYPAIYRDTYKEYRGAISTTAHELQHLIHYNYDQNEFTFVNEGLSEVAEYVTGLGTRSAYGYLSDVNVPIFQWNRDDSPLPDYSRASLMFNYIGDRFGLANLKYYTQSSSRGATGIEDALAQSGYPDVTFGDLLHDQHIANIINDRSIDAKYGYVNPARKYIWIPEQDYNRVLFTSGDEFSYSLYKGGVGYLTFDNIEVQESIFDFPENIRITAVVTMDDGSADVYSVTSGELFRLQSGTEPYKLVRYIISNIDPSGNELTSSSRTEVQWVINGVKSFYLTALATYSATPKYYWPVPYYNTSNVGRFGFTNRYEMPQDGLLSDMRLYTVTGINSDDDSIKVLGEGKLRIAIYSDVNGDPGSVMGEDTLDFSEIGPQWNTFSIRDWNIMAKEGDVFHALYEIIVPVVDQDINSIPLRLDDGKGKQDVTKIIIAPGEFNDMFTDDNSNGEHGVWNEILFVTYDPEAPQKVSAEAGDSEIVLRWLPSLDPGFLRYRVYFGSSPDPDVILDSLDQIGTDSLKITGLENGTTYYFALTMLDKDLKESAKSNIVSATPLSNEIAQISVGVLQNPIYSENLDIYLVCNEELDSNSVSVKFELNRQTTTLDLESNVENHTVFQNTTFKLSENGSGEITGQAKRPGSRYFGTDTLAFSIQLLLKHQAYKVYSFDQNVALDIADNQLKDSYWLSVFSKSISKEKVAEELASRYRDYELTDDYIQVGPSERALPARILWKLNTDSPRSYFIAELGEQLKILPTYYDREAQQVSAQIRSTGEFILVKSLIGEENSIEILPLEFSLDQNFPNPFNPKTTIQIALPEASYVTLEIYNILGQKVRTLVQGQLDAGYHQYEWSGENNAGMDVGSGFYFYRIQSGKFHQVKKMILLR